MKTKRRPHPTISKFTVLKQLCHLIPPHLVPKLARQYGNDKKERTFSAWSQHAALMFAHLTHAIGLNDVCNSAAAAKGSRLTILQLLLCLLCQRGQFLLRADPLLQSPNRRRHGLVRRASQPLPRFGERQATDALPQAQRQIAPPVPIAVPKLYPRLPLQS